MIAMEIPAAVRVWHLAAMASRFRRNIESELAVTRELADRHGRGSPPAELEHCIQSSVSGILDLVLSGSIDPEVPLRLSLRGDSGPHRRSLDRAVRVGVFPTAGNPLHWNHLLGALEAMRRLRLDKVVFLIAGRDPRKPHLLDACERHGMARGVLRLFSPILAYSPLGRDDVLPGELNLFRLLALNRRHELHAIYMAGTDHYRRHDPSSGRPDTIELLEEAIRRRAYGFDPRRHRVSIALLERGDAAPSVPTDLLVRRIQGLPPGVSSTKIRDALSGHCTADMLGALPFSVLNRIRARRLYCPYTEDQEPDCYGHHQDTLRACKESVEEAAIGVRKSRPERMSPSVPSPSVPRGVAARPTESLRV
jgi:hypothetical protein